MATHCCQSLFTLVDNLFNLINAFLALLDTTSHSTIIKISDECIQRIIIFSCIWTFGISSLSGRSNFESWFRSFFLKKILANRSTKLVFPDCANNSSIYDYYLQRSHENELEFEWKLFDKDFKFDDGNTNNLKLSRKSEYFFDKLYYTNIFSYPDAEKSKIIIPTSSMAAFDLIQSCLIETGGNILILGPAGSGKKTLARQIINLAKERQKSRESSVRWICHFMDCSINQFQMHLEKQELNVKSSLIERKLVGYCSVFVEDLSMSTATSPSICSYELLRSIYERREYFSGHQQKWKQLPSFYSVLTSDVRVINEVSNRRFLRHQHIFLCDSEDILSIFASKLEEVCSPSLKYEIPSNFVWLTFNTFKLFKGKTDSMLFAQDITESCRPFICFSRSNSVTATISYFFSKFCLCLSSMDDYTNNEAIRVWDRLISDFCGRYSQLFQLLHDVLETSCLEYELLFPGFTSAVEKEKQHRLLAREKLLLSQTPQPFSYLKHGSGFYKTGPYVYGGLLTAEFVRDGFMKVSSNFSCITSIIDRKSIAFWTDVLFLVTEFSHVPIFQKNNMVILSHDQVEVAKCVAHVAAIYLKYNFRSISLNNIFKNSLDWILLMTDVLDLFLLDEFNLKKIISQLKLTKSNLLISNKDKVNLTKKYPNCFIQLVDKMLYRCKILTTTTELNMDIKVTAHKNSVYNIILSDHMKSIPNFWSSLIDILEFRHPLILELLQDIHVELDPSTNIYFRHIVENHISSQKIVFSFQDTGLEYDVMKIWSKELRYSILSYHRLYDSYASNNVVLENVLGSDYSSKLYPILKKYFNIMQTKRNHSGEGLCLEATNSDEYFDISVHSLLYFYKKSLHWPEAWRLEVKSIISNGFSKTDFLLEVNQDNNIESEEFNGEAKMEGSNPLTNKGDGVFDNSNDLIGIATLVCIYQRFISLCSPLFGRDEELALTNELIEDLKSIDLMNLPFIESVSFDSILLSFAYSYLYFDKDASADQVTSFVKILLFAQKLPQTSLLRNCLLSRFFCLYSSNNVFFEDSSIFNWMMLSSILMEDTNEYSYTSKFNKMLRKVSSPIQSNDKVDNSWLFMSDSPQLASELVLLHCISEGHLSHSYPKLFKYWNDEPLNQNNTSWMTRTTEFPENDWNSLIDGMVPTIKFVKNVLKSVEKVLLTQFPPLQLAYFNQFLIHINICSRNNNPSLDSLLTDSIQSFLNWLINSTEEHHFLLIILTLLHYLTDLNGGRKESNRMKIFAFFTQTFTASLGFSLSVSNSPEETVDDGDRSNEVYVPSEYSMLRLKELLLIIHQHNVKVINSIDQVMNSICEHVLANNTEWLDWVNSYGNDFIINFDQLLLSNMESYQMTWWDKIAITYVFKTSTLINVVFAAVHSLSPLPILELKNRIYFNPMCEFLSRYTEENDSYYLCCVDSSGRFNCLHNVIEELNGYMSTQPVVTNVNTVTLYFNGQSCDELTSQRMSKIDSYVSAPKHLNSLDELNGGMDSVTLYHFVFNFLLPNHFLNLLDKIPDDFYNQKTIFLVELSKTSPTSLSDSICIHSNRLMSSNQFEYQLPLLTPTQATQNFLESIKELFRNTVNIPLHVWESNLLVVHRIRWLLLVYHTVLYFKLKNKERIGTELLITAFEWVNSLYYSNQSHEVKHVYLYEYIVDLLYVNSLNSVVAIEIAKSLFGSIFSSNWYTPPIIIIIIYNFLKSSFFSNLS